MEGTDGDASPIEREDGEYGSRSWISYLEEEKKSLEKDMNMMEGADVWDIYSGLDALYWLKRDKELDAIMNVEMENAMEEDRLKRRISNLEEEKKSLEKDMNVKRLRKPCKVLLQATLKALNDTQLELFHWHLSNGRIRGFEPIAECELEEADRKKTVELLVKKYGPEEAVKITAKILKKMKLNNLANKLDSSFKALDESVFLDNACTDSPINSISTATYDDPAKASVKRPRRALLQDILEKLEDDELETFNWHLTKGCFDGFDPIPDDQLENADRQTTVGLMWSRYGPQRALDITQKILKKMGFDHIIENALFGANESVNEEPPAKRRRSSSPVSSLHPSSPGQRPSCSTSRPTEHEARMTVQLLPNQHPEVGQVTVKASSTHAVLSSLPCPARCLSRTFLCERLRFHKEPQEGAREEDWKHPPPAQLSVG